MAPLYNSIDGVSKEIRLLNGGVNQVSRNVFNLSTSVDGVEKLILDTKGIDYIAFERDPYYTRCTYNSSANSMSYTNLTTDLKNEPGFTSIVGDGNEYSTSITFNVKPINSKQTFMCKLYYRARVHMKDGSVTDLDTSLAYSRFEMCNIWTNPAVSGSTFYLNPTIIRVNKNSPIVTDNYELSLPRTVVSGTIASGGVDWDFYYNFSNDAFGTRMMTGTVNGVNTNVYYSLMIGPGCRCGTSNTMPTSGTWVFTFDNATVTIDDKIIPCYFKIDA